MLKDKGACTNSDHCKWNCLVICLILLQSIFQLKFCQKTSEIHSLLCVIYLNVLKKSNPRKKWKGEALQKKSRNLGPQVPPPMFAYSLPSQAATCFN